MLRLFHIGEAPWALSGAVGISFAVAAAGLLNLAHLINKPVLVASVSVGVLFAVFIDWHQLLDVLGALPKTSLLYSPLVLLIAVPILGNVRADVRTFNYYDDLSSYLTLPQATLQLGSLPVDPFNERRVTSSLGAPYVLQTLMLIVSDVRSIRFIDVSLGFILYAGLLVAIFRLMGLSIPTRIALASLAFLVPVDRWNATMVVLPAALFCALFLIQIHPSLGAHLSWKRTIPLAMTAGALACLKSNYLPPAALICAFYYLAWPTHHRRTTSLLQGVLYVSILLLCMLPWMIDMQHKEGTFLFPILGRGFDASAFGVVPLPNGSHNRVSSGALWVWLTALPMAAPLLLALGVLVITSRKRVESVWIVPLASLLLGSACALAIIASSTGGESLGRYSLPFQIPALIIFLGYLVACSRALHRRPWWLLSSGAITVVALAALGYAFGVRHNGYHRYLEDARLVTPSGQAWFDPGRETRRIHDLQARIPPGERILARLFVTYPFDFKRNQVFVADYPGMAALPPGMPIDGTPGDMCRYLLSHRIRYLAFDPKRTAFPDSDPQTSLLTFLHQNKDYGRHGWLLLQVKVSSTVQHTFSELAKICPHLYDDGEVYLLDLQAMRDPNPPLWGN